LIKGNCEICQTKVNRLSHEGKLQEIEENFEIVDYGGLTE